MDDSPPGPATIRLVMATLAGPLGGYSDALAAAQDALQMERDHLEQVQRTVGVITREANGELPSLVLRQRMAQLQRLMGDERIIELDSNTVISMDARLNSFQRLHSLKGTLAMANGIMLGITAAPEPDPDPGDDTLDTHSKTD
jgi:hypothetical protein